MTTLTMKQTEEIKNKRVINAVLELKYGELLGELFITMEVTGTRYSPLRLILDFFRSINRDEEFEVDAYGQFGHYSSSDKKVTLVAANNTTLLASSVKIHDKSFSLVQVPNFVSTLIFTNDIIPDRFKAKLDIITPDDIIRRFRSNCLSMYPELFDNSLMFEREKVIKVVKTEDNNNRYLRLKFNADNNPFLLRIDMNTKETVLFTHEDHSYNYDIIAQLQNIIKKTLYGGRGNRKLNLELKAVPGSIL